MLLPSSLATQFTVDVKQGSTSIDNAVVYLARQYLSLGNSYKTISAKKTDSSGKFVENFELNQNYQATVVKNGAVLGIVQFSAICTVAPCELTLVLSDTSGNIFSGYETNFASGIAYNLSYNQTSEHVVFTYVDTTGLATYARLLVESMFLNDSQKVICDNSLYSVSGTITCNMSGLEGDYKATTFISRSPEKIISFITFVISNFKDSLGPYGLLIALIFGSVVVGFFFFFDVGAGIMAIPALLSMLKLMQIVPLGWTAIIGVWVLAFFLVGRVNQ